MKSNRNNLIVAALAAVIQAAETTEHNLFSQNTFHPNNNGFAGVNWYNPFIGGDQFTATSKEFIPTATHAIFAQCNADFGSVDAKIAIAQVPKKAPIISYDIDTGDSGALL